MGFDSGAGGSVLFEIFSFGGILGCGLYERVVRYGLWWCCVFLWR